MPAERTILHVDMDAFFVSVELLRHPELRGRPVVVGGDGARGVVAAASYEARAYGVYSALGSVRAKRLCPNAVFLQGDHHHYREVSDRIMELLHTVTPLVEPLSLDEAFLDVTGVLHGRSSGAEVAENIRSRIMAQEHLSCAVGVAPSKFLAKVASKLAKPVVGKPGTGPREGPGVLVVNDADKRAFLDPLPVATLWGVGPVTAKRLGDIGVRTIRDLAALPLPTLTGRVGKAAGEHLHQLAHGIDVREVVPDRIPKSVGNEETFPTDHVAIETLVVELLRLVDATTARMRDQGVVGRTVTIKVRYADFRTVTRSSTLGDATSSSRVIMTAARRLLEGLRVFDGVRLLGVSMSSLQQDDGARQLSLALDNDGSWDDAEQVVSEIRNRFGPNAIAPAAFIDGVGVRVKALGDQQWGPNQPPDAGRDPSKR